MISRYLLFILPLFLGRDLCHLIGRLLLCSYEIVTSKGWFHFKYRLNTVAAGDRFRDRNDQVGKLDQLH